jgi:hypothetical protein
MILVPKPERYSRRKLLKGLGVGMGMLPLLNSERVRAQSAGVAKRLITITWGSGVVPGAYYVPAGALGTLPPILAPLDAWKSKVLAIRGSGNGNATMGGIDSKVMVDVGNTYGGHSSYPSLLTGTATGTQPSIDTLYATQLASAGFLKAQLNVGCRPGSSSTSWRAGKVKNTAETDPYRLFNTLFAGASVTPAQISSLLLRRKSVLDHVIGELTSFQTRIGTDDKQKVQAHLDSVRAIENQLTGGSATPTPGAGCMPPPNTPAGLNFKTVANFPNHVKLMMDLVAAAVKCDKARAITIDLVDNGGANTLTFPWLNIPSPDFHAIAHQGAPGFAQKTPIDVWFFTQVASLVGQLAATPEGAVTTLDNTVVLVCNDMNEGDFHDVRSLPYLIIGSGGGFFKTGTCVQLASNAPNNQLLASVCHAMDLQIANVGDTYTGDLDAVLKA